MRKAVLLILIAVFMSFNANATNKLHVVQPGDTLWGLSKSHYKDPYLWGKIWMNNTYLNDPNLIFPGEVIEYTKYGITIYKGAKNNNVKINKNPVSKYDSFIFFNGCKFYSDCGGGFCVWKKKDVSIGKLRYDKYKKVEVTKGDTVFIYTRKNIDVSRFYIYREVKNRMDVSICPCKSISVFVPIGSVKVIKKIKPDIYEGIIDRSYASIEPEDTVSCIYPYKYINVKHESIKLNNVPVKLIHIQDRGLTTHIGYYMFFYVKNGSWEIRKRKSCRGYHVVKAERNISKNIVGKTVYLDRVDENLPVNTPIGKGVVVSQYKNYIAVFFDTYNSGLREIPDMTKNYVLR